MNAGSYRAVLISKHFSQKSLEAAQGLKQRGVRIVYDFCDNYLHNPMEESKRQGKTARLRQFLELADKVVVSTEALAEVVVDESRDRKSGGEGKSVVVRGDHGCRRTHKKTKK